MNLVIKNLNRIPTVKSMPKGPFFYCSPRKKCPITQGQSGNYFSYIQNTPPDKCHLAKSFFLCAYECVWLVSSHEINWCRRLNIFFVGIQEIWIISRHKYHALSYLISWMCGILSFMKLDIDLSGLIFYPIAPSAN